jgi:hypothetical protein
VLRAGRLPAAGKDHVVHAGRAHVLVGVFPHHPAQRLDKIGLAAAVRADDSGQSVADDEFHRFDEGLEAEDAQLGEFHEGRTMAGRIRPGSGQAARHEQPVSD